MRGRDPSSDRVRVVPELRRLVEFRRLNFMDADYGSAGKGRRHLLPQRDHLFRPAHATAHSGQAHAASCAGRISVCRPRRDAARAGSAACAGGSCALQEGRCRSLRRSLPEIYVQPGESHLVTRADDFAHGARLMRGNRLPGSAAWHRRALPSHAAALPGKPARQAERGRGPPLRRLCHSRHGAAIGFARRAARRDCRSSSSAAAMFCRLPMTHRGRPWAN